MVLLPATTRYEQAGGGTETTTERRIVFSPEIPGPRSARPAASGGSIVELARRVNPDGFADCDLTALADGASIRAEIARVIPTYEGIQRLSRAGEQVQWGGTRLCEGWIFPTSDGKAHAIPVAPRELELEPGEFLLSTRRGKQFNSMVWQAKRPADRRAA